MYDMDVGCSLKGSTASVIAYSYAHPQLFNAMVERERLEDDGIGDELMEMQEILWPIKRLRAKDFAIDMLFEYEDDNGSMLVWCQGRVVAFIKESI
jgi:hypothetical protein